MVPFLVVYVPEVTFQFPEMLIIPAADPLNVGVPVMTKFPPMLADAAYLQLSAFPDVPDRVTFPLTVSVGVRIAAVPRTTAPAPDTSRLPVEEIAELAVIALSVPPFTLMYVAVRAWFALMASVPPPTVTVPTD
jgi:hypothetical protein